MPKRKAKPTKIVEQGYEMVYVDDTAPPPKRMSRLLGEIHRRGTRSIVCTSFSLPKPRRAQDTRILVDPATGMISVQGGPWQTVEEAFATTITKYHIGCKPRPKRK